MRVIPLTPSIGARIENLDVRHVTPSDVSELQRVLDERGVVFIPGQHGLSVEEHIAFGRRFGELQSHPNLSAAVSTAHPEIFELRASKGGVANEWHTDLTFQQRPARCSILHMRECPPVGGDTMWTSLGAAYDALSPPMQNLVNDLSALHDALPHNQPEKMAVHPVVRRHPRTGRKCLYVSEHFTRRIVEMDHKESDMLLRYLTRHVQDPRFTVRWKWTKSTIAIWDNTQTQHCVLNNFVGERHIQRVTIAGDEVEAANRALPVYDPFLVGALGASSRHDRQLFQYYNQEEKMPGIAGGGVAALHPAPVKARL